jgi:hypothetical protein
MIKVFNTVHVDSDQAKEIDFHRQMTEVNVQNHSEQIVELLSLFIYKRFFRFYIVIKIEDLSISFKDISSNNSYLS